jgi:hypothetical protein
MMNIIISDGELWASRIDQYNKITDLEAKIGPPEETRALTS